MNERTSFTFAHDLASVAQELMVRATSSPKDMPMTLRLSHYLEEYAGRVARHMDLTAYLKWRIDMALRGALVWRMYVTPKTPGNPSDADFVQCLRAIALDLSFLAQRGYKVDAQEIHNYALLAKDIALRVADSGALQEKLRLIR